MRSKRKLLQNNKKNKLNKEKKKLTRKLELRQFYWLKRKDNKN